MKDLVWIGIRESEIKYCDFINNSINIFGNNENSLNQQIKKNINHNNEDNFLLMGQFYNKEILRFIKKNKNVKFMYYSQIYTYDAIKKLNLFDRVICLNNQNLINFINNKFKIKDYLKDYIPILKYTYIKGKDFNKEYKNNEYVVQSEEGSGGSSTFLVNKDNINSINLEDNQIYMVTNYCKNNIPINIHILITTNDIILLPISIQNIEISNNRLTYKGSDFIAYEKIVNKNIDAKVKKYTKIVCKKLQEKNYRGILGIDWIIYNNEVYFMEINPRFQNSSTILNKALQDNNLPSLQELNYNCFYNKKIILKPFKVNYSSYISEFGDNNEIPIEPIEKLDEIKDDIEHDKYSYKTTYIYNKATIKY